VNEASKEPAGALFIDNVVCRPGYNDTPRILSCDPYRGVVSFEVLKGKVAKSHSLCAEPMT
jgi:hypothetical protein